MSENNRPPIDRVIPLLPAAAILLATALAVPRLDRIATAIEKEKASGGLAMVGSPVAFEIRTDAVLTSKPIDTVERLSDAFKDAATLDGTQKFFATLGVSEDADPFLKIVQNPSLNPQRLGRVTADKPLLFAAVSTGQNGAIVGPLVTLGAQQNGWMVYLSSGRRIFVSTGGGNLGYPYDQSASAAPGQTLARANATLDATQPTKSEPSLGEMAKTLGTPIPTKTVPELFQSTPAPKK